MGDAEWPIGIPYEDYTYRGLLYTNGELFFMYQDISKGLGAIVLTHLKYQLDEIRTMLNTWAESDAYLSKPCNETAPEGASPDTLCVTPMPTVGLVGFLSDKGNDTRWYDKYDLGSGEASGTKVKKGYTFRGTNDGVWWPLGETYRSKGYDFAKYGLTVVATVAVHDTPKDDTPLLTVDGDGVNERLGLWYKNKQWKVVSNNNEELAIDLKTQKEYRVALVLKNNAIFVYVNGESRGNPQSLSAPGKRPFDIRNIFFGGCGLGSGIRMTVTNVLLYHRVLNNTELEAISKTIAMATSTGSGKPSKTLKFKDSSVCVRMGFTLFFLLGCFYLAIFC